MSIFVERFFSGIIKRIIVTALSGYSVLLFSQEHRTELGLNEGRKQRPLVEKEDPLISGNYTTSGLTQFVERQLISQRSLDVPYHEQTGPRCGPYALKMVMHFYHLKDSRNLNPKVETQGDGDSDLEKIYFFARRAGFLWDDQGTTIHSNIESIARAYGYKACSVSSLSGLGFTAPTLKDLKSTVKKGIPAMVAVKGVNERHRPSSLGKGGHWVVIEDFVNYKGNEYVILKHGWSGGSILWRVEDFERAWSAAWRATVYVESRYR